MFINIPRFREITDPARRSEELERFLRELVGKIDEELDEVRQMKEDKRDGDHEKKSV